MIRSSVNLDCFISVSLKVTDSTHFWRKFRGSGQNAPPRGPPAGLEDRKIAIPLLGTRDKLGTIFVSAMICRQIPGAFV